MTDADLLMRTSDNSIDQPAEHDGMAWIPGGTFRMGSDRHYPEEAPAHRVTADGFWIDRAPVTNRIARAPGQGTSIRTRPSG